MLAVNNLYAFFLQFFCDIQTFFIPAPRNSCCSVFSRFGIESCGAPCWISSVHSVWRRCEFLVVTRDIRQRGGAIRVCAMDGSQSPSAHIDRNLVRMRPIYSDQSHGRQCLSGVFRAANTNGLSGREAVCIGIYLLRRLGCRCGMPVTVGFMLVPRQGASRLVFGDACLKEVFLFLEIDHFCHPREWVRCSLIKDIDADLLAATVGDET